MDFSNSKFLTFINKEDLTIRIKNEKHKFKDVKIKMDSKDLEDIKLCEYKIEQKEDDLDEEINYVLLINKNNETIYEEKIYLLNVEYYLTTGPFNKRINQKPFYSYLEKKQFNLDDIKEILKREKIDNIYNIDAIKIRRTKDNFFENMNGTESYKYESRFITLELHYNKMKEKNSLINVYNEKIIKIYNKINKYSENLKKYDLIYLYASPLVKDEEGNPSSFSKISYREEIKIILDIMKKKKKKFKCLFQCASQSVLRDVLATKKTKVLHISCHGCLDKKNQNYSLLLENLDKCGQEQNIQKNTLKSMIQSNSSKINKIDAIILTSCHSEGFQELLVEICNPKYIIYINKADPIADIVCVLFAEYFYSELTEGKSISESFDKTIKKLKLNSRILSTIADPDKEIGKIKIFPVKSKQVYSSPFAFNGEGELITNENVKINFNSQKYKTMIGKSSIITKVLKDIKDINEENHFSLIYGKKGLEKLDFAESLCVHLFERKYIYNYEIFNESEIGDNILRIIETKIEEMQQHAKSFKKKAIIVIKIEEIEKIQKIKKKFGNNNNCYFIIIIDEENIGRIKNCNCFNALLDKNNAKKLFQELYSSYGRNARDIKEKDLESLIKKTNPKNDLYEPKKISKIVDSYILGVPIDKINLEDNVIKKRTLSLTPLYAYLFLLSKMPSGLPDCFVQLIFKENFDDNLIGKYTMNNWNYFNSDINFKDLGNIEMENQIKEENKKNKEKNFEEFEKYSMKYFLKALKLYAKLLYYYIEKERNKINYPDENFHLIFNSYNNEGIWKSNIPNIKDDENINENEFIDKDFNIENHRENIFYLISYLVKNLKYIDEAYNYIDYLVEILLLFPSYFFLKRICKFYIIQCKELCSKCQKYYQDNYKNVEELIKYGSLETKLKNIDNSNYNIDESEMPYDENFKLELAILNKKREELKLQIQKCNEIFLNWKDNYKSKFKEFAKKFEYLNAKLSLFLYSIDIEKKDILKEKINFPEDNDLNLELNLLRILKKEEKCDCTIKKLLEDVKKNDLIPLKKKSILYYVLAMYYYSDKTMEIAERFLKEALSFSKGIKFLEHRINIDLFYIFLNKIKSEESSVKDEKINGEKSIEKDIEKNIKKLNFLMNDFCSDKLNEKESQVRQEFYDLLEPNTIMLNSNPLNNGFSILSTGIYAQPNNQYYILKKLNETKKEKIKSYIRMKSYILNKQNLTEALKKKGEILIIQSDDFTEKGDIIMESDKGISEKLSKQDFIEILNSSQKAFGYKIVLLCFINSSELFAAIKNQVKYDYLIYFESIDCNNIKSKDLREYNKLIIEFIIDFISSYKENDNKINLSISESNFVDKLNKSYLKDIFKYIIKKNLDNSTIISSQISYHEKGIFFSDPLLDLPFNEFTITNDETNNYGNEMNDIINKIVEGKGQSISCNKSQKEKYLKMGSDIIKRFYRHKKFIKYYCIDIEKREDIELITKGKENKNKFGQNEQKKYFYFIYNCKHNNSTEIVDILIKNNNNYYLIIYDDEEKNALEDKDILDTESSFDSHVDNIEDKEFSVFEKKVNYSEPDSEDNFFEDEIN